MIVSVKNKQVPLVVNIIYSLGTGGLENGLVNIINRTPPDRYQHVIICLTTAHEFAQRITVPDIAVLELHKREGQDWSLYWRLLQLLRKLRPDIIHTRNLAALDVQVLGLFLPGVKRVHGEHGRDIYDLYGANWKYRQLRKFMRIFIQRYITVSRDLEHWLIESIGVKRERVSQIYNGVDQEKFCLRARSQSGVLPVDLTPTESYLVVGTVGRLVEVKDQQLILEAVSLLFQRNSDWRSKLRVAIVGDGPLADFLQQRALELGLADIVWMPGDREDIPGLLQAMDIFLLPSLGEGISNTVLEAMASGLPVIATEVGGNPELVDDGVTGKLVPPGDANALCNALRELLNSDELRLRLAEQALARVRKRFNWDRAVREYLKVYDELLGVNITIGRKEVGLKSP